MKLSKSIIALALVAVSLTACGAKEEAKKAEPETNSVKEIASVVAEYESSARESIQKAGECRTLYIYDKTPAEQANRKACWLNETALVMSTENLLNKLTSLTTPDEVRAVYGRTLDVALAVKQVDLLKKCGEQLPPEAQITPDCNSAMGEAFKAYSEMKSVLDAWKPYM